jgi:AhpD family alkylhydroperoxidase
MSDSYLYEKKVFTFRIFFQDLYFAISNLRGLSRLRKNPRVNKIFQEKIMTVISSVNGCVYCKWFHAKQAVKSGIPSKDVKKLFELQYDTCSTDFEYPALFFAQNYAETNRKPEQEVLSDFIQFYGENDSEQIMLAIRMIFFGNLYGNTLDAFIARLNGKRISNASFVFISLFFFANLPVYTYLKAVSGK